MDHEEFQARFLRLYSRAPAGVVQDHRFVELVPAFDEWVDTGLALQPGHRATLLVLADTRFHALMRVGLSGPVYSGGCATHSIVASRSGNLHVALGLSDEGDASPQKISIAAIRWQTPALKGLRYLANGGDVEGLIRKEIERLCEPGDAATRDAVAHGSRVR